MYDMKPLEEEWLKYQRKKRKPWYVFFVVLIIIVSISIFMINQNGVKRNFFVKYFSFNTKLSQKHVVLRQEHDNKTVTLLNGSLKHLEVIQADNSDVSNVTQSDSSLNASSSDILVDIPILDQDGNGLERKTDSTDNRSKTHLDIRETTSISAYEDVEKRFSQSQDIDDALFLAKSYYKKGNYEKAQQWAFEANKLDPAMEESFLIFVKSKIKLGQKNEAISILNQYLKSNNSKDASILLEQIKNEQF